MTPKSIIEKVMSQLVDSREAKFYLNKYRAADRNYALIKLSGELIDTQLDELVDTLAIFFHLGLHPIIIHGAGNQLDEAIKDAGLETVKRDGLRVTTSEIMRIARPIIYGLNQKLVTQLQQKNIKASGIQHGVFECDFIDQEKYGLVGDVQQLHATGIMDCLDQLAIPVISCLGETIEGQVVNINADIAARELAWALKPEKIIFLTKTGGVLNEFDQIISSISLSNDLNALLQQDWVHSGMQLKLQQINEMLAPMPNATSVSITSVENMLRELFTHRGAGTLINKGEKILQGTVLDKALVQELLMQSFGKSIDPAYFNQLDILKIYTTESQNAMAIIAKGVDGLAYLDKFIVTPNAQGAGVAGLLWRQIRQDFTQLYWRAKASNPINVWYFKKAELTYRTNDWISYSYGIEDATQAQRCHHASIHKPEYWSAS